MHTKVNTKVAFAYNSLRNRHFSFAWKNKLKLVSAMVRVKNGEEFLRDSIHSILAMVDEIVFVDNLSTDSTPDIIQEFVCSKHENLKVKSYVYPHDVVRIGEEHFELFKHEPKSPRLTSQYYQWCLSKCSYPFVMKWDDDMIATDVGVACIEYFKRSNYLQMNFGGENITPDMNGMYAWTAGIEPRIFPKVGHRYVHSPYAFLGRNDFSGQSLQGWVSPENIWHVDQPLYAHLKYCKKKPDSNQSQAFSEAISSRLGDVSMISQDMKNALISLKG